MQYLFGIRYFDIKVTLKNTDTYTYVFVKHFSCALSENTDCTYPSQGNFHRTCIQLIKVEKFWKTSACLLKNTFHDAVTNLPTYLASARVRRASKVLPRFNLLFTTSIHAYYHWLTKKISYLPADSPTSIVNPIVRCAKTACTSWKWV